MSFIEMLTESNIKAYITITKRVITDAGYKVVEEKPQKNGYFIAFEGNSKINALEIDMNSSGKASFLIWKSNGGAALDADSSYRFYDVNKYNSELSKIIK